MIPTFFKKQNEINPYGFKSKKVLAKKIFYSETIVLNQAVRNRHIFKFIELR